MRARVTANCRWVLLASGLRRDAGVLTRGAPVSTTPPVVLPDPELVRAARRRAALRRAHRQQSSARAAAMLAAAGAGVGRGV